MKECLLSSATTLKPLRGEILHSICVNKSDKGREAYWFEMGMWEEGTVLPTLLLPWTLNETEFSGKECLKTGLDDNRRTKPELLTKPCSTLHQPASVFRSHLAWTPGPSLPWGCSLSSALLAFVLIFKHRPITGALPGTIPRPGILLPRAVTRQILSCHSDL